MKKTYQASNISCKNCANLIKGSLEDEFGTIDVNLDTNPKEVTVFIENESSEKKFKDEMKDLGFEIIQEKLSS